jgi:hypothetical protein
VKKLLTGLLVCVGALQVGATSGQFYRFQNEEGVTVIASSIPPNLAYKGYSIIKEDGTVIKTVPRQLTPAEIEKRDKELQEQKRLEQEGLALRHHDDELMKMYSSPRDVEEACDRKTLQVETAIAQLKSNLATLQIKKSRFETEAAQRERDGLPPSPDLLDNLQAVKTQIDDKQRDIAARQKELERVKAQFKLDLERVKMLYAAPNAAPATPVKSASTDTAAANTAKTD